MDKERIYDVLIKLKELPFGGDQNYDLPEIASLKEQGCVSCEFAYADGAPLGAYGIIIKNAGHDFLVYADSLMEDSVDISRMSYEDIERYGRAKLLKRLGLEGGNEIPIDALTPALEKERERIRSLRRRLEREINESL